MIEVRCCCQPQKLLGWLDFTPAPGSQVVVLALPVERHGSQPPTFPRLQLQIATIDIPGRKRYLAVKAEGVPIETLRRCSGFIEATDHSLRT